MSAKRQIIPVFIPHLGCPHDCVFCNQKRISGSLLPACADDIARAIDSALEKLPAGSTPQLALYGGSFTAIPAGEQEELLRAAEKYILDGSLSGIRVSTRPDAIDVRTLDRLRSFGVDTIELGAQSMIDEVLHASGRGHTAQDTVNAAGLIKSCGFHLILQMMTGLPSSSFDRDIETARRISSLLPDGVRIYPTVIIEDTALYDMWKRGKYAEHSVEDAVRVCSEIVPIFEERGIPIIRLGLNPTDDLSGGSAAGGAYHPALGELVRSRIMLRRARQLLDGVSGESLVLEVHPSELSVMIGQHRCNVRALCAEFGFKRVKVVPGRKSKGEIAVKEIIK